MGGDVVPVLWAEGVSVSFCLLLKISVHLLFVEIVRYILLEHFNLFICGYFFRIAYQYRLLSAVFLLCTRLF